MQESADKQRLTSKTHRAITEGCGVLFMVLAVLIAVWFNTPLHLGAVLAAVVVGALGLDALISAIRSKRSLLSRIGPLP